MFGWSPDHHKQPAVPKRRKSDLYLGYPASTDSKQDPFRSEMAIDFFFSCSRPAAAPLVLPDSPVVLVELMDPARPDLGSCQPVGTQIRTARQEQRYQAVASRLALQTAAQPELKPSEVAVLYIAWKGKRSWDHCCTCAIIQNPLDSKDMLLL